MPIVLQSTLYRISEQAYLGILTIPSWHQSFRFLGDSLTLANDVIDCKTPIGILLDRMEEYPDEFEARDEIRQAAIAHLREKHPNGI